MKISQITRAERGSLCAWSRALCGASILLAASSVHAEVQRLNPVAGSYRGLTVMVDFPDSTYDPSAHMSVEDVRSYINEEQSGFNNNNGSIRDYFFRQSNGILDYTSVVMPEVCRMSQDSTYYQAKEDDEGNDVDRYHELIPEIARCVVDQVSTNDIDVDDVSIDADNVIESFNIITTARMGTFSSGIPNSERVAMTVDDGDILFDNYIIFSMDSSPGLSTFAHETGHQLLGWSDLYDTLENSSGFKSRGIGRFGLMGVSTNGRNPPPVNPYFKLRAGWLDATEVVPGANAKRFTLNSDTDQFIKIRNPANPYEFYLIQSVHDTTTYFNQTSGDAESGLIIWHIDEYGSNRYEDMTESRHYEVSVVDASGQCRLENGINPSMDAIFWPGNRLGADTPLSSACGGDTTSVTEAQMAWWYGEEGTFTVDDIVANADSTSFSISADFSGKTEAENAVDGGTVAANEAGFSGSGYAVLENRGHRVSTTVHNDDSGPYSLKLRYKNTTHKWALIRVNSGWSIWPLMSNDDDWVIQTITGFLDAGEHEVSIELVGGGGKATLLDYLVFVPKAPEASELKSARGFCVEIPWASITLNRAAGSWDCGSPQTYWRLPQLDNENVMIKSAYNNLCLHVQPDNSVRQNICDEAEASQWQRLAVGTTEFQLRSESHGQCLQETKGTAPGVALRDCDAEVGAQVWQMD